MGLSLVLLIFRSYTSDTLYLVNLTNALLPRSSSTSTLTTTSVMLLTTSLPSVVPQMTSSAALPQVYDAPIATSITSTIAPKDPVIPIGSPPSTLLNQQQIIMIGVSVGGGFVLCCFGTNILSFFNFSYFLFLVSTVSKVAGEEAGVGPKCF